MVPLYIWPATRLPCASFLACMAARAGILSWTLPPALPRPHTTHGYPLPTTPTPHALRRTTSPPTLRLLPHPAYAPSHPPPPHAPPWHGTWCGRARAPAPRTPPHTLAGQFSVPLTCCPPVAASRLTVRAGTVSADRGAIAVLTALATARRLPAVGIFMPPRTTPLTPYTHNTRRARHRLAVWAHYLPNPAGATYGYGVGKI